MATSDRVAFAPSGSWILNTDDSRTSLRKGNSVRIRKGSYLSKYGLAPGGRRLAPGTVLTARFIKGSSLRPDRKGQ
jgi:hypothetical protein